MIMQGCDAAYDSSLSQFDFENVSFTRLKAVYRQRTGADFEDDDFISFGMVSEDGKLTNAGALLADESPIRHSSLFCTRWNGLNFVYTNSKVMWKKEGDERIELPDYSLARDLEAFEKDADTSALYRIRKHKVQLLEQKKSSESLKTPGDFFAPEYILSAIMNRGCRSAFHPAPGQVMGKRLLSP